MAIFHHAVNAFSLGEDRADLMQEVLLAVWRAAPCFRGESQPTTFLYRVSHNTAMSWRRKRNKDQRQVEQAQANFSEAAKVNRREHQLEQLYRMIHALTPLDRSLILLSLDEVSYREMAEIHGINESLVGVRLLRARTKLMEQMEEHNNESR